MSALRPALAGIAALVVASALVPAHVRLIHSGNGKPLRWGRPQEVSIVVQATGSDDIHDGSHTTAIRNAIAAWNAVGGVTVHMDEDASPSQRARTDWESDSIHLVLFDEDDSSGYFPVGTGIVAVTPVWFSNNGGITDADVLFNGADWEFTTSAAPGAFDVQDVVTHELGHFLGLDHSGWAGATMYPYVDPRVVLHRSLSEDEVHGLRDAYPAQVFASIDGVLRRESNESVIAGAHVVARDASGRTIAGALTSSLGAFTIAGLEAGSYELYATPLDHPVSEGNLSPGHTVQTDFESTVLGTWAVASGEARSIGSVHAGADVTLSLGRNSDPYPLRAIAGQTRSLQVRGAGLVAGSTLVASDPSITILPTAWFGTQVNFQVTVPANAPPGHVDLAITNVAAERSILAAALEVTPPDPIVDAVTPSVGSSNGGTQVTITGQRFRSGARVVIGARAYQDGAAANAGGCTVVDDETIVLTTLADDSGLCDVVVIDATGVEGRRANAFEFALVPTIASLFPPSGSAAGGTQITITGDDFEVGCSVAIDGVFQSQVDRVGPTLLRITTQAYVPGGPYQVEVANPSGPTATAAFAYVAANDPIVVGIDPPLGSASGGDEVTIHGANFTATTEVLFGADGDTGTGGALAAATTFVDAGTLLATTPAHAGGMFSVMVRDSATGQAAVLPSAYTFERSSGGGGGGCSVAPIGPGVPPRGPTTTTDVLAATWAFVAALALAFVRTKRLERATR